MRTFVTTILPKQFITKYGLSFAACNFSYNLMSGGGFDKTYSILPLSVGGKLEDATNQDERFELVYCTFLRKFGGRFTLLASFVEQWRLFKKLPSGSSVWTYNLNTLTAFLFVLLRLFKPSVQFNVIVLDFTPVTRGFGLNRIYLKLINAAHGNICLATSKLFTCRNRITLPGVVPVSTGNEPLIQVINNKYLLSGVLSECIAQLSMVLKTFAELPQCELHITGTVDDENLINEYASNFSNIIYHGQVAFDDYLKIMHSCTFQLSTRNPDYPENQCNFPSKIIETLLHNRIIISTINYPQLKDIKYFKTTSDPKFFKQHIESISILGTNTLMTYANQGEKIAKMFSPKVWNAAIESIEQSE